MGRQAWSQEGLQPGHGTARDITAHQIRIPSLQIGRARSTGGQDGIAKSGGKALDLGDNQLGDLTRIALHIAARDMRIGPQRLPSGGVGNKLLACQYQGSLRHTPLADVPLSPTYLLQRASHVHGAGLTHARIGPRDGFAEKEVHFEDGAALAPARQAPPSAAPQFQTAQPHYLARGQVQDGRIGRRQLPQIGDLASGVEAGAAGAQEVKEGIDKSAGATLHHGPAAGHAQPAKEQAER